MTPEGTAVGVSPGRRRDEAIWAERRGGSASAVAVAVSSSAAMGMPHAVAPRRTKPVIAILRAADVFEENAKT